jgi:hypothetical protein
VNKTFVPNLVESFRKIAKDEAAKFFLNLYNRATILLIGRVLMLLQFSKRVTQPYPPKTVGE